MESRLIELEVKFSHQEVAIEEMQQTLFEQHKTIERLEKSLKRLIERFEGAIGGGPEIGSGNEKPPHY